MMTMAEKKVREQLDRVFTQNGEVKACGRAECRKAIQAASEFILELISEISRQGSWILRLFRTISSVIKH